MGKSQNERVCPEVQQWFGTTFTNNKAGMAEVDKDKVKRVVYEMSKVGLSHSSRATLSDNVPVPIDERLGKIFRA